MGNTLIETVWEAVFERVGDDLRVVTWYDGLDFEVKMRDDIRECYSTLDDREIVDDTIVTQLGLANTESAFKTGRLQTLVRVFEDAYILSWTDKMPRKSGFIISIQRDGETATMNDIEWCIQYLSSEISPLTHRTHGLSASTEVG